MVNVVRLLGMDAEQALLLGTVRVIVVIVVERLVIIRPSILPQQVVSSPRHPARPTHGPSLTNLRSGHLRHGHISRRVRIPQILLLEIIEHRLLVRSVLLATLAALALYLAVLFLKLVVLASICLTTSPELTRA